MLFWAVGDGKIVGNYTRRGANVVNTTKVCESDQEMPGMVKATN